MHMADKLKYADYPPSGSPGSSAWQSTILARAQRRVSKYLRRLVYNDFDAEALGTVEVSGSGTVTYDLALTGGYANLQTGTGTGLANFAHVYNSGGNKLIGAANGGAWYVHSRAKSTLPCDALSAWDYIGLQNTDYIAFGVLGSVDTTLLNLRLSSGGTANFTTAIPFDADQFHDFDIGFDFDAGSISVWMDDDDTPVLTTTSLGNLTSQAVQVYSYVADFNIIGTSNKQLIVDRIATVMES